MKKLALHWKILIGMVLGVVFALALGSIGYFTEEVHHKTIKEHQKEVIVEIEGRKYVTKETVPETKVMMARGERFIKRWIAPWGTIFINALKLIAIPLILASLIKGISDLKDISKFRNMGLRTILIYVGTTVVAISIGLLVVNSLGPGNGIAEETVSKLSAKYASDSGVKTKLAGAAAQQDAGPLQFIVDMVPSNIYDAMASGKMLQVIFFSILFGISLILIKDEEGRPLKKLFDAFNAVILKMVDIIMLVTPYAVFALMAGVVASSPDSSILWALLKYAQAVLIGLLLMVVVYLILVKVFTNKNPLWFLKQIAPAQLVAFSTSSSAATLPVTIERVEEHIGVDKEVSSFVLPVGATINMDGTSLYQAVAAVFIMQVLWPDGLGFGMQMTIVLTALLASIGSAAVPGAGMVMLVAVLKSVNFPEELYPIGLALIFAVDRPLDMCRTTVNVTGDAVVSMLVAKSVGKLGEPTVKNWDDNYKG